MHHQSWYPTFIADVQNQKYCRDGKTQAWSSRENGTPNSVQKSQQSQPHLPFEMRLKNGPNKIQIPNELRNALPENCSKTVDKRNSLSHAEKPQTHCFFHFPNTFWYHPSFCQTRLFTGCPLTTTKIHAACQNRVPHAHPLSDGVQAPSTCFASLDFLTLPCPLQNMRQCHVAWQPCG